MFRLPRTETSILLNNDPLPCWVCVCVCVCVCARARACVHVCTSVYVLMDNKPRALHIPSIASAVIYSSSPFVGFDETSCHVREVVCQEIKVQKLRASQSNSHWKRIENLTITTWSWVWVLPLAPLLWSCEALKQRTWAKLCLDFWPIDSRRWIRLLF